MHPGSIATVKHEWKAGAQTFGKGVTQEVFLHSLVPGLLCDMAEATSGDYRG